jgi:hypothetical protein
MSRRDEKREEEKYKKKKNKKKKKKKMEGEDGDRFFKKCFPCRTGRLNKKNT